MAQLIDGKNLALHFHGMIQNEAEQLKKTRGITPGLSVVLVGNNEASKVYVRNKEAACQRAGFLTEQITLPEHTQEEDLLQLVGKLNQDPKIHGILVQLPLPKHISEQKVLEHIHPAKDVDGFHPVNMGFLMIGRPQVVPCTPLGMMKMLESVHAVIEGKEAVIVGRSNIVGKPMAHLLLQQNATVRICHTRTQYLEEHVRNADILVAAVGKPRMIPGSWIKPGAIVLDVGINRLENGKLCGDVEFDAAAEKASFITPVPGGVGPMTIAMLLWNTLQAAKYSAN